MALADVQTATENLAASLEALSAARNAKVGAQITFNDAQAALAFASEGEQSAFQDAGRKLGRLLAVAGEAGVTPIDSEPETPPDIEAFTAPAQALRLPKLPPLSEVSSVIAGLQKLISALKIAFPQAG